MPTKIIRRPSKRIIGWILFFSHTLMSCLDSNLGPNQDHLIVEGQSIQFQPIPANQQESASLKETKQKNITDKSVLAESSTAHASVKLVDSGGQHQDSVSKDNDLLASQHIFTADLEENLLQQHTKQNTTSFYPGKQAINKPAFNAPEKIKQGKTSKQSPKDLQLEEERVARRRSDLINLFNMVETIEQIKHTSMEATGELASLLGQLGGYAGGRGGIRYADKDADCIRNKYGDVQHHNSRMYNSGGICFEHIYHLSKLDYRIIRLEGPKWQVLVSELNILSDKILYVLKKEAAFIQKHLPEKSNQIADNEYPQVNKDVLKNLEDFIDDHYDAKILTRLAEEVVEDDALAFDNKASRYFIARKLTIIGELSKELSKQVGISNFKAAIKPLGKIRNKLIHQHAEMIVACKEDKRKEIAAILSELFCELRNSILSIEHPQNGCLKDINGPMVSFEKLQELSEQLAKKFEKNKQSSNQDSSTVQASKINLNNVEAKKQGKKATEQDSKTGRINGLIIQAAKIFEGIPSKKSLAQLNKKYQLILNQYGSKASYPSALNEANKDQIISFKTQHIQSQEEKRKEVQAAAHIQPKQEEKKDLLDRIIRQINKELAYLQEIESDSTLVGYKKNYIIQHIVANIGQYMRDIGEYDVDGKLAQVSSRTLDDACAHTIQTRNKGLSHDIFSFDQEIFSKTVSDELLPAQSDWLALNLISSDLKSIDFSVSIPTLIEVGCAFGRLGFYDKSINYFDQAIRKAQACERLRQFTVDQVGFSQIEQDFFTDLFQGKKLDIEPNQMQLAFWFINYYCLIENYPAACALLNGVYAHLNLSDINDGFKTELMRLYSHFPTLWAYINSKQSEQPSIALAQNSIDQAKLFEIHLSMAQFCFMFRDFETAEHYLKLCEDAQEPDVKFHCLNQLGIVQANQLNFDKNTYCKLLDNADELQSIHEKNKGVFKRKYSDQYYLHPLDIINYKLNIIAMALVKKVINYEEVKDTIEALEQEALQHIEHLPNSFMQDIAIGDTYCSLAAVFAKNPQVDVEKVQECHSEAQAIVRLSDYYKSVCSSISTDISNHVVKNFGNIKDYDRAIEQLEYACSLQAEVGDKQKKSTPTFNLGVALHEKAQECYNQRKYNQAIIGFQKAFQQFFDIKEACNENNDHQLEVIARLGLCKELMGDCAKNIGQVKGGIEYYQEAVQYYKEFFLKGLSSYNHYENGKKLWSDCHNKINQLYVAIQKFKLVKTQLQQDDNSVKFVITGISKEGAIWFLDTLAIKPISIVFIKQKLWIKLYTNDFVLLQDKIKDIQVPKI